METFIEKRMTAHGRAVDGIVLDHMPYFLRRWVEQRKIFWRLLGWMWARFSSIEIREHKLLTEVYVRGELKGGVQKDWI